MVRDQLQFLPTICHNALLFPCGPAQELWLKNVVQSVALSLVGVPREGLDPGRCVDPEACSRQLQHPSGWASEAQFDRQEVWSACWINHTVLHTLAYAFVLIFCYTCEVAERSGHVKHLQQQQQHDQQDGTASTSIEPVDAQALRQASQQMEHQLGWIQAVWDATLMLRIGLAGVAILFFSSLCGQQA